MTLATMQLDEAAAFFYEHAGWSYDPTTETSDDGRRRCALRLARSEALGRSLGMVVGWEPDSLGLTHADFFGTETEPDSCELATCYGADGRALSSVGCVDDATEDYRRVVAAELMGEAVGRMLSDALAAVEDIRPEAARRLAHRAAVLRSLSDAGLSLREIARMSEGRLSYQRIQKIVGTEDAR